MIKFSCLFIKKFHINETRLKRNNYQTKNSKFKNTCLTEGLIRNNVPVLVDQIDFKFIKSKFKPIQFGRKDVFMLSIH